MSNGNPSRRERALSGTIVAKAPLPAGPALPTSATALLLVVYNALSLEQQEDVFAEISELRLQRLAGAESETALFLRSLRRIADHVGEELSPDKYRSAYHELVAAGEGIHEFGAVTRFFGSWRQAKDALSMSVTSTPFKIEARFRRRMVGKVHHYREETLRETLADCVKALGRVPLVIEFGLWRQKEVELAKTQGRELFLPSDSPYRRRWGTWEAALLHFGYDVTEVKARLEPSRERAIATIRPHQYREDAVLRKRAGGV
ncbi:MAG: hypothetical protein WKF41_04135 [Gaiellaceae bacterium]